MGLVQGRYEKCGSAPRRFNTGFEFVRRAIEMKVSLVPTIRWMRPFRSAPASVPVCLHDVRQVVVVPPVSDYVGINSAGLPIKQSARLLRYRPWGENTQSKEGKLPAVGA